VYPLLRVLSPGKHGFSPPPSLSEKCEAAVGVCLIRNRFIVSKEYQADLGVYLVGQLLVDFTKEYVKDFPNLKRAGKVPLLPWRAEAARLDQALKAWQKDLKDNNLDMSPLGKKVHLLSEASKNLFDQMRTGKSVDPRLLQTAVNTLRPTNGLLFQNVPELKIDLTAGPDE